MPARLLGLPQREGASLREHLPAEGPAPLYALPARERPHRARALRHHIPRRGAEPPSRQPSRSPQLVRKRGPHDRRRPPRSLARPSHRQAKQARQRAGGMIAGQHASGLSGPRSSAFQLLPFLTLPCLARRTAPAAVGFYARGKAPKRLAEMLRAAERSEAAGCQAKAKGLSVLTRRPQ